MRLARATQAARARLTGADRRVFGAAGGRKHRKLFLELLRAAMRARRAFPFARAHEHFAVFTALAAMKFVNWHRPTIANARPSCHRADSRRAASPAAGARASGRFDRAGPPAN